MLNKTRRRSVWLLFGSIVIALGVLFWCVAQIYIQRYELPLRSAIGIYTCFLLLLLLVIAPGVTKVRVWIRANLNQLGTIIVLLCLPYLAYSAGTFDIRWLALTRVLIIAAAVPLTYRLFPVTSTSCFSWQDLAIAVFLAGVLMSHQQANIWNIPVKLDFIGRLFLIAVSAWSWLFVRKLPGLGYKLIFTARVISAAALNFIIFSLIAVPISLSIGFTRWNPRHITLANFGVSYVEIFLFVALLEELFFRGFLQNLISHSLHSQFKGKLLVSCLFGLFHILHAPFPNWRYVLLATMAGWFYGTAFEKGETVMASALAHALVDTAWRAFF